MKVVSASRTLKLWRVRIVSLLVIALIVGAFLPSDAVVTVMGQSGAIEKGTWVNISLSNFPYQKTVGMDITTNSSIPIAFASREDKNGHAPQIVKTSSQGTVTVIANADSTVTKVHPNSNYGTFPALFVEKTRDIRAYVKFDLPVNTSNAAPATTRPDLARSYVLRLWALTSSATGVSIRQTSTKWIESGPGSITYNNHPYRVSDAVPTTVKPTLPPTIPPTAPTVPPSVPPTIPPTVPTVPPTVPPSTTVRLSSSIPNNCSRDVTASIQAALSSLPTGKTLEFGANGCYRVDGILHIVNRSNIVIDGNGATVKQFTNGRESTNPRRRSMFSFEGGSNLAIRNITVQGAHPDAGTSPEGYVVELEAQMAFDIQGVQGMVIENNHAYDMYGDFVYLGVYGKNETPSRNIIVRNNHFERNGRQGISLTGSEDILIENNYIGDVRMTSIDVEPNHAVNAVRRVMVRNNNFGPGRLTLFSNYGHSDAPIEDISFINNVLTGHALNVLVSNRGANSSLRKRYTFSGNVSDAPWASPSKAIMTFVNVSDVVVTGNTQPFQKNRDMKLVELIKVTNSRVSNNTLANSTGSVFIDSTTKKSCNVGNMVGSPLILESASIPCL